MEQLRYREHLWWPKVIWKSTSGRNWERESGQEIEGRVWTLQIKIYKLLPHFQTSDLIAGTLRCLSRPLFLILSFLFMEGKCACCGYIVCPCTLHSWQEMVTFAVTHQIQWKHMFCQVYHQNTGCSSVLHPHFSYILWQVRKMWRKCTSHWHTAVLFQRICCQSVFFNVVQIIYGTYQWCLALFAA